MSDVLGTVVAIQGNDVKEETLGADQDGYVLTWDNNEEEWAAKPTASSSTGLRKEYFTSNDTWVCPEGVTNVLVIACGGGSGGFGGYGGGYGGSAGKSAVEVIKTLSVIPNTEYTITIGAGGNGGSGSQITQPNDWTSPTTLIPYVLPTDGGTTSFVDGSTVLFSVRGALIGYFAPDTFVTTYSNGINGTDAPSSTFGTGGIGGQFGPQGNGGNGGNGNKSTGGVSATASNGSSAAANTGAGGGAGGGCGYGSGTPYTARGGDGGNGGSGYLYLIY